MTELSACLIFGQRAGRPRQVSASHADLLSCAGMPDHQKAGKEPAPAAHDPFAALRGNLWHQPLVAVRPNSLRAYGTPFRQTAASQFTKRLHSTVQPRATRGWRHRRGRKRRMPDAG